MKYTLNFQDADFKEVLGYINKISYAFADKIKELSYVSGDVEIQELLSEKRLNQFLAIIYSLNIPFETKLKNCNFREIDRLFTFDDKIKKQAILMQMWILLGSALESLLQIFLGVYLRQYENSGWGKWENFKLEETKENLLKILNDLKEKGIIDQKQKNTFKKDIKDYLKSKQQTKHLTELTLGNLINFYYLYVFREDENADEIKEKMDFIRENRNCVHSFKERDVGTLQELLDSLKFFIEIMLELYFRLPSIDWILESERALISEIKNLIKY